MTGCAIIAWSVVMLLLSAGEGWFYPFLIIGLIVIYHLLITFVPMLFHKFTDYEIEASNVRKLIESGKIPESTYPSFEDAQNAIANLKLDLMDNELFEGGCPEDETDTDITNYYFNARDFKIKEEGLEFNLLFDGYFYDDELDDYDLVELKNRILINYNNEWEVFLDESVEDNKTTRNTTKKVVDKYMKKYFFKHAPDNMMEKLKFWRTVFNHFGIYS